MFRISPDAISSFAALAQKSFEARMVRYLAEFFPDHSAKLGGRQLRELIRRGIANADKYEIRRECDVAKFIDLMMVLGSEFDKHPDTAWVRPHLLDPTATAELRLERVFRQLLSRHRNTVA